jgi:hypothetical protein
MDNESKKMFAEKIGENVPLVIIIFGGILFFVGAAGGLVFQGLQIPLIDAYGRYALMFVGALILVFGASKFQTDKQDETKLRKKLNSYKIEFNFPISNARVPEKFEVRGGYKLKPPDDLVESLWIIEYRPETRQVWPKNPIMPLSDGKSWYLPISIGGEDKQKIELIVAYVGTSGKALLNYSLKVGREANRWISIDGFPPDIIKLATLSVECERKSPL